jgi:hypothetical protein
MWPTRPRKIGETVSEVAERRAGPDGENAKCSRSDARTCIGDVQKDHQPGNRYGGYYE